MHTTRHSLKKGEQAIIKDFDIDAVPLKLLEMGCLPGNLVRITPNCSFGDPLYLNINGSHVAIRVETAKEIEVDIIKTNLWVKANKTLMSLSIGNPNVAKLPSSINLQA